LAMLFQNSSLKNEKNSPIAISTKMYRMIKI
jgi:hypothetical protein